MKPLLLVNFGGPRNTGEIRTFLEELLCDQDVIRTNFPQFFHNLIFKNVAKKRATAIQHDYESIGGKSPLYEDTEELARLIAARLQREVIPFHRYLPATHADFLQKLDKVAGPITVLPLFPQFSYATTGSIARFFEKNLCGKILHSLRWIRSYASHQAYIDCFVKHIKTFLIANQLKEEETCMVFSAHGLPQSFVCTGDLYQEECEASYHLIKQHFATDNLLAYQSKFGPGLWLKPYTADIADNITDYVAKKNVVFIPLSFTSDHIETLFEVEQLYLPPIRAAGKNAYRCPAFHNNQAWLNALETIIQDSELVNNQMLIRKSYQRCCTKRCPQTNCQEMCLCTQQKD